MICSRSLILLFMIVATGCSAAGVNVTAKSLASSIIANTCGASRNETIQIELYQSMRQSYSSVHDTQYPLGIEANPDDVDPFDALAASEPLPAVNMEHSLTVFYGTPSDPSAAYTEFYPRVGDLKQEYLEWCLHLFSEDNVYGCIKGNQTRSSGGFELLGLLDNMWYTSPQPYGLVINVQGPYVNVFEDALLSCTINLPWVNETRGAFWRLSIPSQYRDVYVVDYPEQDDGFLVVGEKKIFSTDIFTGNQDLLAKTSTWFKGGKFVQLVVDVQNNCTQLGGDFFGSCLNETIPIATSNIQFPAGEFSSCVFGGDFDTAKSRYYLSFNSPSVDDTGEYTFVLHREQEEFATVNRSFHISVVFTEFPFNLSLPLGRSANLSCAMKAPSDATVYWLYNSEPISNGNCSQPSVEREQMDEDGFSMIYLQQKLCEVAPEDIGQYSCVVEYTLPRSNRMYSAQLDVHASFTLPKDEKGMKSSSYSEASVAIGASVAAVVIVLIVVVLLILILIWQIRRTVQRKRRRTLRHRPSKHLLLKPHLIKGDDAYVDLTSPDIKKTEELEFPRQNLELQVELGTGKFGRVFKAKAHGMVSSFPHINTVAVKTTLNSGSFGENCRLLNELELLKKLYKQPHKNICNVLGHCIETDPMYIIMEYACYGNLKRHLVSCRDALLRKGQEPKIHSSTATVQLIQQPNELTGQLDVVTSVTNPLQISLNLSTELKDTAEKSTDPTDSSFLEPGQIEEAQLCCYAAQIANGLKHLAYMGIVHCDLAARNILIAEKGVLKIGDFGMAREVGGEEAPYQNLRVDQGDSMIAVKWAAPELLDMHPHTFKSDVWSYGITIWEIASYGSEPFSGFKMGASLELFLRHLQEGNQPAKPAGLPNYLYRQLCSCWSVNPTSRPSAEELAEFFENVDPNTLALEDILDHEGDTL